MAARQTTPNFDVDFDQFAVSDQAARERTCYITGQFSQGDTPVGAAIQRDCRIAYRPEQASLVFENLMAMQVRDWEVPFLPVGNGNGNCISRKDLMLRHMLYHQELRPEAIGIAVARIHEPKGKTMIDYAKRIEVLFQEELRDLPSYNEGFVSAPFEFHTAPTIRVALADDDTDLVLDPAICEGPVTLEDWGAAVCSTMKVSVCHKLLDGTEKRIVLGDLDHETLHKVWYSADDRPIPTLSALIEDCYDCHPNAIMYQRAYLDEAYEMLKSDRSVQLRIAALARHHGCDELPNCGPRALAVVAAALERRINVRSAERAS